MKMEEQIEQQMEQQEETPMNETKKYLDAIQKLKNDSVSKDDYAKLQEENKNLLEAIAQGAYEQRQSEVPTKRTNEELYGIMTKEGVSPIDFVEAALEFRQNVWDETGKDVFVASGHMVSPNQAAYDSANHCAEVYRECLDTCDGNPGIFMQLLQDRISNVTVPRKK